MNKEIENIIKRNLPEKKEENPFTKSLQEEINLNNNRIFNQALSQIDTKRIADEVLKVVVEKIQEYPISLDKLSSEIKQDIINLIMR